jgi:hypothetical protein
MLILELFVIARLFLVTFVPSAGCRALHAGIPAEQAPDEQCRWQQGQTKEEAEDTGRAILIPSAVVVICLSLLKFFVLLFLLCCGRSAHWTAHT